MILKLDKLMSVFSRIIRIAVWAVVLCSFASSCHRIERERNLWLMAKWTGREIFFPSFIPHDSANYRILVYVRKEGCTSCRLHLSRWREFLDELDEEIPQRVPVLFCFHSNDTNYIDTLMKGGGYKGLYYMDPADSLNQLNAFNGKHSVFLLNKSNRVELIGNPATNTRVGNLYMNRIKGVAKADLRAERTDIDLGSIKAYKQITTKIDAVNCGLAPFSLDKIETSCDCVSVLISKSYVMPGDRIKLTIKVTPETDGEFVREINLKGVDGDSLKICLSGKVVI